MRLMRFLAIIILLALVPVRLAAAPAAAPTPQAMAAFARSIADAKSAIMTNPQSALTLAVRARGIAESMSPSREATIAIATAKWLQAEALIGLNDIQIATPIVEQAVSAAQRTAPSSKLYGDLMRSRGAIAWIGGHVQEALADYQRAHEIFRRAGELRSQAIALQDIGEIYLSAGDYQRVLDYYTQSNEAFPGDPSLALPTHNNRGEVLREMKRIPEAIIEYKAALAAAHKIGSPLLETRILSNLAMAQVDLHDLDGADASIAEALRLSASGEAHGWRNFVFGPAARIAAARGQYDRSAKLLEQTFAGTDITKTSMPFKEFHLLASQVYDKLGRQSLALVHLRSYQRLDSEARNLTASTNAQLMAARFDFTNQNLKISTLKQGQLQRDIELERQRTTFRTVVLSGLLGAAAIVFALLLAGYVSIRRSRNEVSDANDNLTATNDKLEKALRAKTEFLATTSHEIRTPLNGILGMTQVLLADPRVEAGVRSKVEVVHGAGEAMRALVDDILDVAKMETGDVTVAHEETDLAAILDGAMRLWSGQAETKGIALVRATTDCPARILSDPVRLRQIVFNLMSNAVKFTLEGSVTLSCDVEPQDGAETMVIRVADTGIGIDPQQHESIFEAFRQVDTGTSRQFGGTGLGLAICRRLAAALGGGVTVESVLGAGATFTLRLPLARVSDAVSAEGKLPEHRSLDTARVLLVERNMLQQSILRAVLAPATARFEVAASPHEARDALAGSAITHLVIDAASVPALPDGGGADSLGSLRALVESARDRSVRTTILFTPSDTLTHAALGEIGATQLIAKPIGGSALVVALQAAYEDTGARRTAA